MASQPPRPETPDQVPVDDPMPSPEDPPVPTPKDPIVTPKDGRE